MQANVDDRELNVVKEATRGWLEMVDAIELTEKRHEKEMGEEMGDLRRLMTRNYNALVKEIEKNKEVDEARHAEIAKKWIRDNLEEAQRVIDNIVGIKGITENPLKAAIEAGIVHEEEEPRPRLEMQNVANIRLPRVSISSSIVPSNEELYGY
jgi:hypothetical protein